MNANQKIHSSWEYSTFDSFIFKTRAIKYMMEEIATANYAAFQSNLLFFNKSTPFTLIVDRNKDNDFNVTWWMNNWGTFYIETPIKRQIAKYWYFTSLTQRRKFKDWKQYTLKELIARYGAFNIAATHIFRKTTISNKELEYEIINMMKEYIFDLPSDRLVEGKIACIYKEHI